VAQLLISKLKAVLLHALVTAVVAVFSAFFVFVLWYPSGLARYMGGGELYFLVLSVELVLGPLMSLIIYHPRKSFVHLRRDYAVIGVLQVAALTYGLHSTYIARPVFQVFVIDKVVVISALELDSNDLNVAPESFSKLSVWGPMDVCVSLPADAEAKSTLIFSALAGKDVEFFPQYYSACEGDERIVGAFPRERLEAILRTQNRLSEFSTKLPAAYSWLPVRSRFGSWVQIFPGNEISEAYYLDVDPYM
jgi:hypothetical protein